MKLPHKAAAVISIFKLESLHATVHGLVLQGRPRGDQAEGGTATAEEGGGPGGPSQLGLRAGSRTTTASTLWTRARGLRTSCAMCTWCGEPPLQCYTCASA